MLTFNLLDFFLHLRDFENGYLGPESEEKAEVRIYCDNCMCYSAPKVHYCFWHRLISLFRSSPMEKGHK